MAGTKLALTRSEQSAVRQKADADGLSLPQVAPADVWIRPRAEAGPVRLSLAQERLWFIEQINPGNPSANISQAFMITGDLKEDLLQQSLQTVVNRHESLRTTFATDQLQADVDSKPVQLIAETRKVEILLADLSLDSTKERETKTRELARAEAQRPFDLTLGPLLRVTLVKLSDHEHVLLLCLHRIICDDWSFEILTTELWAAYSALSQGDALNLPSLPIQYADYASWQCRLVEEGHFKSSVDYWRAKLHNAPTAIELPSDRPRPPVQTWHGKSVSLILGKNVVERLRAIAEADNATVDMTLLAVFMVMLWRYIRQPELVIGWIIPNRDMEGFNHLIGPLANVLGLRANMSENCTFRELLARVREVRLEAERHRSLPFEKLLEELQLDRSLSHSPVFQVAFNPRSAWKHRSEVGEFKIEEFDFDDGIARFELAFDLTETTDQLDCHFRWNTDLFDDETGERMRGHFEVLLAAIVANPNHRISDLPLLTELERKQLLLEWNDTSREFAQTQSIPQIFESQVERTPEATAAVFGEERISYAELNRRANQLAHHLRHLGVEPDTKVGICIGRSIQMLVGVLAVLKAGGAYVPLDPAYPEERLRFMIGDAGCPVLLIDEKSAESIPSEGCTVLSLDKDWKRLENESQSNPAARIDGENLAYVIYTSGSTGRPKGVAMPHRALSNLLSWQIGELGPARTLQFASLNFDVSFQEMFSTWCSGGTLVLVSEEIQRDTRALLRLLEDERIERLFLPFVLLQHLAEICDDEAPGYLREIVTAGEQLEITPQIIRLFNILEGVTLYNHYGPSESHVVTAYKLDGPARHWRRLPSIGRPVSNTRIYIVDENSEPAPVGVPGELCIAGTALSRGYLNRPDLTAEKYSPDPFSFEPGSRIYRTGDLARYLADGNIEFLGRIDNQVKIRGYRVELGEIEAVLREHPAVRDVAVVARQGKLVAYVVSSLERLEDGGELAATLRHFIKQKLPDHMSPAIFVALDVLPLTPNGKVDRRALPIPDDSRPDVLQVYVGPRDRIEEQLTKLWEKVLGLKSVGVRDNFFELGGHSLLAARLFAEIENRFGKNLPLASLFQSPTVEQLAYLLRGTGWQREWSSLVVIQKEGLKPPLFCIHAAGANVLIYRPLSRHLGREQPVYALQAQGLDAQTKPYTRIEDMAAHYIREIRKLQPEGPYYLLGASFGGLVIFEMAQQLLEQGQETALLAMLNTNCPVYSLPHRIRCHIGHLARWGAKRYIRAAYGELNRKLRGYNITASNDLVPAHVREVLDTQIDTDDPLVRTVLAIARAQETYRPRKIYPGKIVLFWAKDAERDVEDNRLGWRKLASGGLEVQVVPGTHGSMREEPNVAFLVEKLKSCLEKLIRTQLPLLLSLSWVLPQMSLCE